MNSYDKIAKAVRDFWKANYPEDVIAFFRQKYAQDYIWKRCEVLVECSSSVDYETVIFRTDFCEGQTDVTGVVIVPLSDVTSYYYKEKIEYPDEINTAIKRGKWVFCKSTNDLMCSNCLRYWIPNGDQYEYYYCPNCGARMEE